MFVLLFCLTLPNTTHKQQTNKQINTTEKNGNKYFRIVTANRVWEVKTENEAERTNWILVLEKIMNV
jgi:hypothetical protein